MATEGGMIVEATQHLLESSTISFARSQKPDGLPHYCEINQGRQRRRGVLPRSDTKHYRGPVVTPRRLAPPRIPVIVLPI